MTFTKNQVDFDQFLHLIKLPFVFNQGFWFNSVSSRSIWFLPQSREGSRGLVNLFLNRLCHTAFYNPGTTSCSK